MMHKRSLEYWEPTKVAVDIGGGAAKGLPELLRKIGCNVEVINEEFAGCQEPDPTSDELTELISVSEKMRLGLLLIWMEIV